VALANADNSPGARLVINDVYNGANPASGSDVTVYDDIPLGQRLPIALCPANDQS